MDNVQREISVAFFAESLINRPSEFRRFLADESGLTTSEYAVAGALIAITLAATFDSLGSQVASLINVVTVLITF